MHISIGPSVSSLQKKQLADDHTTLARVLSNQTNQTNQTDQTNQNNLSRLVRLIVRQWGEGAIPPKWDGKAAERIVEYMERPLLLREFK